MSPCGSGGGRKTSGLRFNLLAMSAQKFFQLSKDATVPISVGLLIALIIGVYTLAVRIERWESTLIRLSRDAWSESMEIDAWIQFREKNFMKFPDLVGPDIRSIRREHN
jgi:hypothetical protein